MTESLPLAVVRVSTYEQMRLLTRASGFFFERDQRLFLVTSRHVMFDEPSKHFPVSGLVGSASRWPPPLGSN